MALAVSFGGLVAQSGYAWEQSLTLVGGGDPETTLLRVPPWNPLGKNTPRLHLCVLDARSDSDYKAVQIKNSGLFRDFAAIELPDGIIAFANRYGTFGGRYGTSGAPDFLSGGRYGTSGAPDCSSAEDLAFEKEMARLDTEALFSSYDKVDAFANWEYEIRSMRFLIEVWDALMEGRRRAVIARHFTPDRHGRITFPSLESLLSYPPPVIGKGYSLPGDEPFYTGTPVDAARDCLHAAINARLRALRPEMQIAPQGTPHGLTIRSESLLATLWTQFALAVAENKKFRSCDTCGRAFELDPDINRVSRFYCDDACRVKAFRHRKAKAWRLNKQGKTPKQIAQQLGSDIDTVKGWLKPRGDKK